MRWERVKGFENYIVSEMGVVVNTDTGHYLKPFMYPNGQLRLALCKDGVCKFMYVNRLVAETFVPNPHGYKFVRHIDGDCTNNDYRNLMWSNKRKLTQTQTGVKSGKNPPIRKKKEHL